LVSASVSLPIGVGVTRIRTDILHIGEVAILTVTHTIRTTTTILTTRKTIPTATATAIRVIVASGATLVRAIKATVAIIATKTLAIQIVMTSSVPQDHQMGWRPMALLGATM
jgi:hypothetical protein